MLKPIAIKFFMEKLFLKYQSIGGHAAYPTDCSTASASGLLNILPGLCLWSQQHPSSVSIIEAVGKQGFRSTFVDVMALYLPNWLNKWRDLMK